MKWKFIPAVLFIFVFCSIRLLSVSLGDETEVEENCIVIDGKLFSHKIMTGLNQAIILAKSIKDKDEKETVLSFLEFYKNKIQSLLLKQDYTIISETGLYLYENIAEVLAECTEMEIQQEISSCICKVFD